MIPVAKPLIGPEERAAVDRVLTSGQVAQGPEVDAFEHEFATYLGQGLQAIAVSSGTTALHLALIAAGIGEGDEVIVPSFTFAATANAVRLAGATPVFADISARDFCLEPEAVKSAITPRTSAIIPVHLYGHPAPMDELTKLADLHDLLVVEDAAQAHGASYRGQAVGTLGQVAAFSFYPTKNMTTGEGGMVVTADPEIARRIRLLRNQGMQERYRNEIVGFNARMTDLAAAIGRVQLSRLPAWVAARRSNASRFDEELADVLQIPQVAEGTSHAYHQYTVRTSERGRVQAKLAHHGIGSGVYYPVPVHRLPAYNLSLDLDETTRACEEVLSLPVHPGVTEQDVERIITAVRA